MVTYGIINSDRTKKQDKRGIIMGERMKRGKTAIYSKCILVVLVVFCLAGGIFGKAFASAEDEGEKRVLFISSYSYSWPSVPYQIAGIKSSLGENVNLEFVFMDTKEVDDKMSRKLFLQTMQHRMLMVKPYDAVIAGDDAALQFVTTYQNELFEGIPIVFEGIDDVERAIEAGNNAYITGIAEQINYEENIEIGLKVNPKATKIVAILDDTLSGKGLHKQFYALQDKYPELEFDEINCSKLTRNELCDKLMHVSEDTILWFLIFTEDADGNMYTTHEGVELITKYASVPVYRMVLVGMGEGLLGGYMVSHEQMGAMAGEMTMKILNGGHPEDIAVITESPNMYCFDEEVINKFRISKQVFPVETVFLNGTKIGWLESIDPIVSISIIAVLLGVLSIIVVKMISRRLHYRKMKELAQQLDPSYSHDTLTGIRSRMAFLESLQKKMMNKTACTVIMFDIDDFNKFNDELGHTAGDILLQQVAARLAGLEDNKFKAYRLGGDEFVGIVKSGEREVIDKYISAIHEITHTVFELEEKEYIVQFSIGVAIYPKDGNEVVELVNNAGIATAQVKKFGKDGFCYYQDIGA